MDLSRRIFSDVHVEVRYLFDKFWRWPVISGIAVCAYGYGVSAMFGDQYFVASSLYVGAWVLLAAWIVGQCKTDGRKLVTIIFVALLAAGAIALSLWWVKHTHEQIAKQGDVTPQIIAFIWAHTTSIRGLPWQWILLGVVVAFLLFAVIHIKSTKLRGITPVLSNTGHEGCEREVHELKASIARWQRDVDASNTRNAVLEVDLEQAKTRTEEALTVLEDCDAELSRWRNSQLKIIFALREPYQRIYPSGGEQRVAYFIGIRSAVLVEDLVVEVDAFREDQPNNHRELYHLHEEGDEPPYKRSYSISPEDGVKLFPIYTIIEDIKPMAGYASYKQLKVEINEEADIPIAFMIIARGSNTLPRKQKIYLRTPLGGSAYPMFQD